MRRCFAFAAVLVLTPSFAGAQTTTEDGIRALVRADYQAAVRILRPLAEGASEPDGVAQFLMATLYDTGRGVERNTFRACGLFLAAAMRPNPFMQQASQISTRLLEEIGPAAPQFCVPGSTWEDRPPATFTLAPNHSIVFTDTSITVTYNGTETRTRTGGLPGMVSLPIRHIALDVSRPVAVRRHFIQWSGWMPDAPAKPSSWSLGWMVSEVVGGEFVTVVGDRSLVIVAGARPPAAFDVAALAHVRVNANGEAEWVIAGGTNPRSAVIPGREPR
jgi:hypothetical protein